MPIKGLAYLHAEVTDIARSKRLYGETLGWELHTIRFRWVRGPILTAARASSEFHSVAAA